MISKQDRSTIWYIYIYGIEIRYGDKEVNYRKIGEMQNGEIKYFADREPSEVLKEAISWMAERPQDRIIECDRDKCALLGPGPWPDIEGKTYDEHLFIVDRKEN